MSAEAPTSPRDGVLGSGRLLGVDAARGLALVGMMSVHVLPTTAADGGATLAEAVAGGRSSALFAVLAGVGVALTTGGRTPPVTTRAHASAGAALLVRGALVALVGLSLAVAGPPVAVVLAHYGLLFVLAVPLLPLGARALAVAAACWAFVGPVLGHLLRALTGPGPGEQPDLAMLADPALLLQTLLVTGYYPVLAWLTYLLAGMAVGRSDLRRRSTAVRLLVGGAALAVAAKAVSWVLLGPVGGLQRLEASLAGLTPVPPFLYRTADVATALEGSLYGTTPTTSWWWLAVASPHSSTPLDLAHTTGTALAAIGACLLLARVVRTAAVLLAGAGSVTLTAYTGHVAALDLGIGPASPVLLWSLHVTAALLLGVVLLAAGRRGPMEAAVRWASRSASRAVSRSLP